MKILFVEGNVGAGKTSVLRKIDETFGERVRIVEEPVALWEEHGLLSDVYDGTISRVTFQFVALITKTATLLRATRHANDALVVAERSPYSDAAVFGRATIDSDVDRRAYQVAHASMTGLLGDHECAFVFLEGATTGTLSKRILARNRHGESQIGADFLQQLERYHADLKASLASTGCDVLGVDCGRDAEAVAADVCAFVAAHLAPTAGAPPPTQI
tara:strand:- start:1850 stop:2497 length:648 start_codon:yes stop_codon:yes gene_type:complete